MEQRLRGGAIAERPATVVVDFTAENVGSGTGYCNFSGYLEEMELQWLGVIVLFLCCA